MQSIRNLPATALLVFTAAIHASTDQLEWFSVATPGQDMLYRADVGLLGQDEAPSSLVDLAARGGSYTGMDLTYQSNRANQDGFRWSQPQVDFGLETAVEALPGLVFGLDAMDHHPQTAATDPTGNEWQLFDPQGGLRLGGGVDLLRAWRQKHGWRWVVAGWIPVFSQTREWEIRSGLLWSRKFRADVSASWSTPGIPGRWVAPTDSSAREDTTWWRSDRSRWTIRFGGAPAKAISAQIWGGRRQLTDPGAGTEASWRNAGQADFAGLQTSITTGPVAWDFEMRGESGDQLVRFQGSSRPAGPMDSSEIRASVDYTNGSVAGKATIAWSTRISTELELSGAWMDLENGSTLGVPPKPLPASGGSWSSTKRLSGILHLPLKTRWIEVSPFLGVQCRIQKGDWLPLWQGLVPYANGRSWSLPLGLQLMRRGGMGGKASYTLSGEIRTSGDGQPKPGLRHHIEMQQGF